MKSCPFTATATNSPFVQMSHLLSENSEYFDPQTLYEEANPKAQFPADGTHSEDNIIPLYQCLHTLLDTGLKSPVPYTVQIIENGEYGEYDVKFRSDQPAWATKELTKLELCYLGNGHWRSLNRIKLSGGQLRFVLAGNLERRKLSEMSTEERKALKMKRDADIQTVLHSNDNFIEETLPVAPLDTELTSQNWKDIYSYVLSRLNGTRSAVRFAQIAHIRYELKVYRFLGGDPNSRRCKKSKHAKKLLTDARRALDKHTRNSKETRLHENIRLALFDEKFPNVLLRRNVIWSTFVRRHKAMEDALMKRRRLLGDDHK